MKTTIEIEAPTYFETIRALQDALTNLICMRKSLKDETIRWTTKGNYYEIKMVAGPLPDRCLTDEEIK